MGLLCAGFNVPVSVRPDAYWKGMAKMSIIEFARCIEYALSEDGPEKIPNTKELWNIRTKLKTESRKRAAPPPAATIDHSWGMRLVNGMFMRYLYRRRFLESFKGDLDVPARRQACLTLGSYLQGLKDEDLTPTLAECETMFAKAMAGVQDATAAA